MKKVFSDIREVSHLWANQTQDSAKNSGRNFYFEGPTIYSYGHHFPIATIVEKDGHKFALFTERTYSNTTAKHIQIARIANHLPVIYMHTPPDQYTDLISLFDSEYRTFHQENISVWASEIKNQHSKLLKARKKEIYLNEIERIISKIQKYIAFFGITVTPEIQILLNATNQDEYKAYLAAEAERIEKERKEAAINEQIRIKAAIKKEKQQLTKWRKFQITHFYRYHLRNDFLRFNPESNRFETSQGIEIPLQIAREFYQHIKTIIASGGCKDQQCSDKLGQFMGKFPIYEINKKFIRIGCHTIEMREINNMAKYLN